MGYLDTYDFEGEYITWTTDGVNAGKVFYRTGKFNCTNVCGVLKITEHSHHVPEFVALALDQIARDYVATNLANPKLMNNVMARVKIGVPKNKSEQRAIAAALGDVDALLAGLERLIARRRAVKQAAMDALLSGRVRLPGFGQGAGRRQSEVGVIPEDWEVKRIGEMFDFLSTSSCSRGDLSEDGDIFYIHYGDIHTKWNYRVDFDRDVVPRVRAEKVRNASLLRDGDLILVDASEDEAGAGKGVEIVNLRGRQAVAGLHTIALRSKGGELADGFRSYIQAMQTVKSQIRRLITGLKVFGISKTNLEGVMVPLPSLPEQRAIAAVLSDMDAAIAALERQRDKVQALKQGMMAELLTGRVRLVRQ